MVKNSYRGGGATGKKLGMSQGVRSFLLISPSFEVKLLSFFSFLISLTQNAPGFEDLEAKVFSVFPIETLYEGDRSLAFCLADYKVQGSTLKTAAVDIKDDPSAKGQSKHSKFRSRIVQLSRV